MTKRLSLNGNPSTRITYSVSRSVVESKDYYEKINSDYEEITKNYRPKEGEIDYGTVYGFLWKLKQGYAVNAICNGAMKRNNFCCTYFIAMDFDDLRMDIEELKTYLDNEGLTPTIIHTSFSDGLTAFDDGTIKRKYHCYWLFSTPLLYEDKDKYTQFLLHRLKELKPDGHLKNCVQWIGGMRAHLTEDEMNNGCRFETVVIDVKDFDDIIAEDPTFKYIPTPRVAERVEIENCWEGEHRNLFCPIAIEYDEFFVYEYKGEEGKVDDNIRINDDGKRVHIRLVDGQHRRKALYRICCQFRINAGDEDGTRVGYEELLHSLRCWGKTNVVYNEECNDSVLQSIVTEVLRTPFAKLVGNGKTRHKIDTKGIRRENVERNRRGEDSVHYNKYLSMSRNKAFDEEVLRILRGHYSDKPKEQLSILKEFGMEITVGDLRGVKNRHSDVFPKKPSREDILDMLADCEDITVKGRLSFLEETYGVKITRQTLYNYLHPATDVKGCRRSDVKIC